MFIPRPDRGSDHETWDILRATDFGHLAVLDPHSAAPHVVPTTFTAHPPDGDQHAGQSGDQNSGDGIILIHLATPNPVWPLLELSPRATFSVAVDVAQIPVAWKAIGDEDPEAGIPTTYYAATVADCDVEFVHGDEALLELLRTQLAILDPAGPDPIRHLSSLPGIRGMVLHPRSIETKVKVGGNVDRAHRLVNADRLAERGRPGDAGARTRLLDRLPPAPASPS